MKIDLAPAETALIIEALGVLSTRETSAANAPNLSPASETARLHRERAAKIEVLRSRVKAQLPR